jgi:hypothetical protein
MISGCLFVFPAKNPWRLLEDSERRLCFLAVLILLLWGSRQLP